MSTILHVIRNNLIPNKIQPEQKIENCYERSSADSCVSERVTVNQLNFAATKLRGFGPF